MVFDFDGTLVDSNDIKRSTLYDVIADIPEAADVLKVSVSSLKARLHRGRVLLRKYLQDYVQQSR